MKARFTAVLAVLTVGLLAAPAAAQSVTDENATADVELSFGQQISIMVTAQQAEVENTVENAAFELAFSENKTEALNERAHELAQEMQEKQRSLDELEAQHSNGELTDQEYAAKKMKVQAGAEPVNESANNLLEKAEGLSQAEKHGVNVDNIRLLANNASEMTGPEVAEVARGIAGTSTSAQHADGHADNRPDTPGDAADNIDEQDEERSNNESDEGDESEEDRTDAVEGVEDGSNGGDGGYAR